MRPVCIAPFLSRGAVYGAEGDAEERLSGADAVISGGGVGVCDVGDGFSVLLISLWPLGGQL